MKRRILIIVILGGVATGILYVTSEGLDRRVFKQLGNVVGMYASIEPNEYSMLAQEIKEKQAELDNREIAIAEKESVLADDRATNDRTAVVYVTVISSLLLVLVMLNFYLDWKRRK